MPVAGCEAAPRTKKTVDKNKMPKAVDRECFVVPIRAQLAGRRNRCGIANQDIQPLSSSRRFNPLLQRSCRRPRLPNTDKVQLMEVDRPGPLLLARMFLDPRERFLYARTLPRYVWRAGVHSRPAKRQVDSRALSDPLRSAGGDMIISALVSAKDKGATPWRGAANTLLRRPLCPSSPPEMQGTHLPPCWRSIEQTLTQQKSGFLISQETRFQTKRNMLVKLECAIFRESDSKRPRCVMIKPGREAFSNAPFRSPANKITLPQ